MEQRAVKQRFFAFRNGLLADMLRKQGVATHRTIFGLNIPQLREIAAEAGCDAELAAQLWADSDVRESRLLAPMIAAPTADRLDWLEQVQTFEEADILCHSLLRCCPEALAAAGNRLNDERPLVQYCALRLLLNLAMISAEAKASAAELLNGCRPLSSANSGLCDQLRQLIADNEEGSL